LHQRIKQYFSPASSPALIFFCFRGERQKQNNTCVDGCGGGLTVRGVKISINKNNAASPSNFFLALLIFVFFLFNQILRLKEEKNKRSSASPLFFFYFLFMKKIKKAAQTRIKSLSPQHA
jgi:hypothetical protein